MEIPNKEYLMAWFPGVSTPWMLRPHALCEGRESNCSHHGDTKVVSPASPPTLAKNARMGHPQLWWRRQTSFKGWASRPMTSKLGHYTPTWRGTDDGHPCYNFHSPERVYVEADPVISSAGGSIIPRISAIQAF